MKKISYRSRPSKDVKPVKNLPAINNGDNSTTENAGRFGFIMPGDIYPVSSGNPPEIENKINPTELKRNLLYLKSKDLDKKESLFVSFLFNKVAEVENFSYEKMFIKDMLNLSLSAEPKSMEIINDMVVAFSNLINSFIKSGINKDLAQKKAYLQIRKKYSIKKSAQANENDPKSVAKYIANIILIMISKFSLKSRVGARSNVRRRITNMNIQEMSNKKAPAGAAIGTSIALVKNILNGKDPYFIKTVIDEIQRYI